MSRRILMALSPCLLACTVCADELPKGAVRKFVVTEDGEGTLWSVALSPDGKYLACGGSLKKIHLWDARSCEHLRAFGNHPDNVWALAFSPGGRMLCSGGRSDLTLRVWDPAKGEELTPFLGHRGGITKIKFFPDGKRLIMSGGSWDPTIRIWDVAKREQLRGMTGHGDLIDSMDLAANGRIAISGSRDGTLRLWSLVTGKELQVFQHPADDPGYSAVAISPDGRLYASGTYDGQFQIRETLTHRRWLPVREKERLLKAIAFAPDGRCVALAGERGTIEFVDLRTGETVERYKGHQSTVYALDFSRDGKLLASAGADATAFIWQVPKLPDVKKLLTDEERAQAWERLASENPVMARHAIAALANDADTVTEFLSVRLKPASKIDEQPLERWIAELDNPRFGDRERARQELEKAGELAGPKLMQALAQTKSLEARRRLERLVERIEKLEPDAEQRRALRAVAALEQHGGEAARRVLDKLAGGAPGGRLTIEAKEARERIR